MLSAVRLADSEPLPIAGDGNVPGLTPVYTGIPATDAPVPTQKLWADFSNSGSENPSVYKADKSKLDNIPPELQALRQWVNYKKEADANGKLKKVPYCAATNRKAKVTDANTWSSYDTTIAALATCDYNGIGFVFITDDHYAGIDIDGWLPGDIDVEKQAIHDAFAPKGYVERSPSGNGIHIIVKGIVPQGKRRAGVEIYSTGRYFTMTGDVISHGPIKDAQPELDAIFAEWTGSDTPLNSGDVALHNGLQVDDDAAVLRKVSFSNNGSKFNKLLNGDIEDYNNDKSSADLAFCNFLHAVTQNGDQIWRILQNSALGRDKHNRSDYRDATLAKAKQQPPQPFWADMPMPSAELMANLTAQWEAKRNAATPMPAVAANLTSKAILPIIEAVDLIGEPPQRQWLVPDAIPQGNVTLIYGNGGDGKSLLALQLAVATAKGRSWIGWPVNCAGPALIISAEDDLPELHRRSAAIARAEGLRTADLTGLHISPMAGLDALLAIPSRSGGTLQPTPLLAALAERVSTIRPAVIIIDTLADTFGGNEVDRPQVRQFVGMLRKLAIDYATAVVVLAHPSLSGMSSGTGTSGSTAWSNSVRSRLYLKRDERNPQIRTLELMKSNYSATGKQVILLWQNGIFVPVSHAESSSAHRQASEHSIDELFLEILAEISVRGQNVSRVLQANNYAPKLFASHDKAKAVGVTKQGIANAMDRLFISGQITETMSGGPPSRSRPVITLTSSLVGAA